MLTSSELTALYTLIDNYIASEACKSSFMRKGHLDIDFSKMILCVDEMICENFDYPNPNKITDKVNKLNGKNDFNKTLVAIKNNNNEIVASIKYFDLPK